MSELTREYWNTRYRNGKVGWNVGYPTSPITSFYQNLTNKSLRILIPGGGNGYEAEYLHQQGFTQVYLLDWADEPLKRFAKENPDFPQEHLLHQDFFELQGKFDHIVEQTFFCAIEPAQRLEYARKAAELLNPGGELVGVLFNKIFEKEGPPFGGNYEEYQVYFRPYFRFLSFEECYNSIEPRQGSELFIHLQKL